MTQHAELPAGETFQQVLLSRSLILVVKNILTKVIGDSERAVVEITEKLQGMTVLGEDHKNQLSSALEHMYTSTEADGMKNTLNDAATAMLEAAAAGDFAEVERISRSDAYQKARHATKKLHDTLQNLTTSDVALNDYIMPVLVALQFQDSVRQEIESVNKSFDDYIAFLSSVTGTIVFNEPSIEFWNKISKNFNNIEARNIVLKTVFGADFEGSEKDVRKDAR